MEQLDIDLPEIQEIDAHEIIKAKLNSAVALSSYGETGKSSEGSFFVVEDTSLYLDCLSGLPGPLIKWFEKTIGNDGLYDIARKYDNYDAQAKTVVGYCDNDGKIQFFNGTINGKIVTPQGEGDFGWGPIFMLDGYNKTFAQMSKEEKNKISMRRVAFEKLKDFL